MIPRFHQRQDGRHLCRHSRCRGDRRATAFQGRHAFLEHGRRGVHQARIDVTEGLQIEQAGGVIGIVEDVGGRLVDGHRPGAGRGVGKLPGVQAQCLQPEFTISHGYSTQ